MELLGAVLNKVGSYRLKLKAGVEHVVCPVSMLVPGVLSGSRGPVYYPPDEVAANAPAWQGTVVVLRHPYEGGKPTTANSPGVWEASGLGWINDPTINRKTGGLVAEAWLIKDRLEALAPGVWDAIKGGQPVEVSTGLVPLVWEDAQPGSVDPRTGMTYNTIARQYEPDHLAILPDQVGACSIKDGCGLLVHLHQSHERGAAPVLPPRVPLAGCEAWVGDLRLTQDLRRE